MAPRPEESAGTARTKPSQTSMSRPIATRCGDSTPNRPSPTGKARFHNRWEEEAKYLPSTFPSFSRVLLSDDGNLWIEHFQRPGAERREWVVFTPAGEWLRIVYLPLRMVVQDAGADWVLVRTTDELGVERIELFALVPA